jgi:hypothetical protein
VRFLLATLFVAACNLDTAVLVRRDAGGVDDCARAWLEGPGAPCVGALFCDRPHPLAPACCSEILFCSGDELVQGDPACAPSCGPCDDDSDCAHGLAICVANMCQACGPPICPPCPDGLAALYRNGCETCFCGPPSECTATEQCGPAEICYPGAYCATGCAAGDLGCCVNACSSGAVPCTDRAPLGCKMNCAPTPDCPMCVAGSCECEGGTWVCYPACSLTSNDNCVAP